MTAFSRIFRIVLAAVLACAASPRVLTAQVTFGDDTAGVKPLGLSLSGGISMGSYQAGVNFGLLELYRHAAWNDSFHVATAIPRYRLRSVTGASAGNINTLLWAIEACTDVRGTSPRYHSPRPDSSLFWQVWGTIGWTRIFNDTSSELAVFDRKGLIDGLAKPILSRRMRDPRLVRGCTVPAGITLTRVLPDSLRLQQLAIQTQRVVTPFRVTVVDRGGARGDTRVAFTRIDDLPNGDGRFGILAHLARGGDIAFADLLEAVKASAAFPIAFAPVRLPLWYDGVDSPDSTMFLDGGVFDNNPVGFARNLYGAQGDTVPLDILYVNPVRYRRPLLDTRGADPATAPSGGLASVARFVGGAVPTARQYELQLLARERAHQEREQALLEQEQALRERVAQLEAYAPAALRAQVVPADTLSPAVRERLLLSSRAYPIFGEHLAAFAAFLARPAREFDFYVGMYDAAHMVLWHHTCADAGTDSIRHDCVGRRLPELIAGDTTFMRDPARQIAILLYNREFPDHALPVPPVADGLRDRFTVQTALFRAMGTQFTPVGDPDTACPDPRLISRLLCGDGLRVVLDTLRHDRAAFALIDRWADACERLEESRRAGRVVRDTVGDDCHAEPVFRDLLANPLAGGTRVLDEVFERLRVVERGMRADPTFEDDDYLRMVSSAQFAYYASHLRSRVQRDWIPSSAPRGAWLGSVPVSYMGANLGAPGLEMRWTPTYNLRMPNLVRASVLYHYNAEPEEGNYHWLGVGAGFGRYSSRVIVSEWGAEAHYFRPASDLGNGHASVTEAELYTVLLAGQLRLSGRVLVFREEHGRLHGDRGFTVSAGLADPTGLAFWVYRILFRS
ncbi:MAG TPA: patatin-like phospholipase family protein [Longimicrobium sp.]